MELGLLVQLLMAQALSFDLLSPSKRCCAMRYKLFNVQTCNSIITIEHQQVDSGYGTRAQFNLNRKNPERKIQSLRLGSILKAGSKNRKAYFAKFLAWTKKSGSSNRQYIRIIFYLKKFRRRLKTAFNSRKKINTALFVTSP